MQKGRSQETHTLALEETGQGQVTGQVLALLLVNESANKGGDTQYQHHASRARSEGCNLVHRGPKINFKNYIKDSEHPKNIKLKK